MSSDSTAPVDASGKEAAAPATTTPAPSFKRTRAERNDDLNLELSAIPSVRARIERNNAETKLRLRLTPMDFLNRALTQLAEEAATGREPAESVTTLVREFFDMHGQYPRNKTLARVLYVLRDAGRLEVAMQVVRLILDNRERFASQFENAFDERVATLALRVVAQQKPMDEELVQLILNLLSTGDFKRRVFFPLLVSAEEDGNAELATRVFESAVASGVELWDVDFNKLLLAVRKGAEDVGPIAQKVLSVMARQHPVVGASNAAMLQQMVGGERVSVGVAGVCPRCQEHLRPFELAEPERLTLVDDIVAKLITPRVQCVSHYEPDAMVTPEVQVERWAEFDAFKSTIAAADFDTVIDGANVGYYGLSSWYREAKEELLRQRGVDPDSVPLRERTQVPFPVDVSPRFSLIERVRSMLVREGKKPIVILHTRHLTRATSGENKTVLEQWNACGCVVASPAFLNDDYCWLYAAVWKRGVLVVSNDLMCDHHFLLLSRRSFLCWRQRHRVSYLVNSQNPDDLWVGINFPKPYSTWVQEAGQPGGEQWWHVPLIAHIDVLGQETNKVANTPSDMSLNKDGDDYCTHWLCTKKEAVFC